MFVAQPLVAVADVTRSSRWYEQLLDGERMSARVSSEFDDVYDRILCGEEPVLQVHAWDVGNHPNLVNRNESRPGHGVLLWFEVDDFDSAVSRARSLRAEIVEEPHVNAGPHHHRREIWLRDPDGYLVVLCSPNDKER